MTKIQKLEAALRWALRDGARWSPICEEFQDQGCGCCSDSITPPEEFRDVLMTVAQSIRHEEDSCG